MSLFTYSGTDERYYPTLGVTAVPGKSLELETAPDDGRWIPGGSPVTPAPKTETTP